MNKLNSFVPEMFAAFLRSNTIRKLMILLLSVVAAMAVGSVMVIASGADPFQAYYYMLIRPLTSINALGEVSMYFTPLLLIAIGVSVTFHCKLSNLGGGGQMLFGALGMTLVGVSAIGNISGPLSLLLGILMGIVFGACYAAVAAFFRARFSASEIVVTLMLNYIAEQIISYIIFYHLKRGAEPQSAKIAYAMPKIWTGSRINYGVLIALLLVIVYAVVIYRTRFGFNIRTLGGSVKAASYNGVNSKRYFFIAMVISGAFCGLAGAMQISGNTMRLMEGVAGDFGFSGIVVAMLGSLNPIGIVIAAFFMALLSAGSVTMQVKTGIPTSFTSVLEALIVLFILLGMAINAMQDKKRRAK